jgi:hypothetical protein
VSRASSKTRWLNRIQEKWRFKNRAGSSSRLRFKGTSEAKKGIAALLR